MQGRFPDGRTLSIDRRFVGCRAAALPWTVGSYKPERNQKAKEMKWLFVYGSLRRGQENHCYLADQRFLGAALTQPRYRLVQWAGYPALVVAESEQEAHQVAGEVWEVTEDCLAALDAFEEVPHLYIRHPVELAGSWPREVDAYFLSPTWASVSRKSERSGLE
jgi:gamma-glutamylcyclotransferase (GGCT)/AIG2-like uncharacterized protein YtfP